MRESEEDLARRLRGYSWSLMRNALQKLALDGSDQIKDVAVEDCFDTGSRRQHNGRSCSSVTDG